MVLWLKTSNMNSKQHGHKLSSEVDVTRYLNLGNRSEKNGTTGYPIHYSTYIGFHMETQICNQNELCFSDGGLKCRIFLSLLMERRHMNYIYILFLSFFIVEDNFCHQNVHVLYTNIDFL